MRRDAFTADYKGLVDRLEKDSSKVSVTKEELERAFSDSRKQLDAVTNDGLPMGWSRFPYACISSPVTENCKHKSNWIAWITWAIGIGLTGVFAGLGAPFWYDAVAGISRVVQNSRAIKKPTT